MSSLHVYGLLNVQLVRLNYNLANLRYMVHSTPRSASVLHTFGSALISEDACMPAYRVHAILNHQYM